MVEKNVRVRFAPSPTGPLHMGGVRTALYNYLFARQTGGTFVLRIEDTDQVRFVEGAEEYIEEALAWCGFELDESPSKGGPFGPYRQSERKEIYREYADLLIEKGHAYYAFDTAEELDECRAKAEANGNGAWKYDASTRQGLANSLSLSKEIIEARLAAGEPYVIRLRIPENETISFVDMIRGEVSVHASQMDDKVIFKSDGMPTYHLANIVDDHLMEITHVIRGEEWLPSAPLHALMYRCFGWERPEFAHLPLILKPDPASYINKRNNADLAAVFATEYLKHTDGADEAKTRSFIAQLFTAPKDITDRLKLKDGEPAAQAELKTYLKKTLFGKLSKRDGDRLGFPVFPIDWNNPTKDEVAAGYREAGYFSASFINMLAFLGWNPGTEQELFSKDELIAAFSFDRVSKSGARFHPDKARWFNQQYLWQKTDAELGEILVPLLEKAGISATAEYAAGVASVLKERVHFVAEMVESDYFFAAPKSYDQATIDKKWQPETNQILTGVAQWLDGQTELVAEELEAAFKQYLEDKDIAFGAAALPLRIALTGGAGGPGVFDIIVLIGKKEAMERIHSATERISVSVAS